MVDVDGDRVEVLFPTHRKRDSNNVLEWLATHLSRAQQTIDLALFVFSAQSLANILQEEVEDGIAIRLITDPGFASQSFPKVLDLLGVGLLDHIYPLEENNQPFKTPLKGVGTPRLA